MRLILALILAAGMASAQTTVNITNSLIGPVTQNFSNTQVNVSQALITGAVVNASVTGLVVEASITNSFAPVNNVTNDVSISNVVNVGNTIVNNTNSFSTVITNNVQVDVAGVIITNIIENIVQSNNYFTTITGAVVSVNSATGAVTLTVSNTTNSAGVASWSGTVLSIGTNVPAGGGGIAHWSATNGTATHRGSFLYPTSQVPAFSGSSVGLFISTNQAVGLTLPDGTVNGGPQLGPRAISLVPEHKFAQYGAQGDDSIAIGPYARAQGLNTITIGSTTVSGGSGVSDTIAIGYIANATANGATAVGRSTVASGEFSLALGGGDGTRNARATAARAAAIGFRPRATNFGSVVIADGVDVDKGSQGGSNTITFAFDRGAYFTQTNTVYAQITPTSFWHSGFAGISVTQKFLDAASTIRTNIFVRGILVSGYTE